MTEDFVSPNLKRIAIDPHGRVLANLACGHGVLPTVPRAGNNITLERPLSQGPAPMQAGIVDRVKVSPDVGYSNGLALHLKFLDRARGNFFRLPPPRKRHSFSFLPIFRPLPRTL